MSNHQKMHIGQMCFLNPTSMVLRNCTFVSLLKLLYYFSYEAVRARNCLVVVFWAFILTLMFVLLTYSIVKTYCNFRGAQSYLKIILFLDNPILTTFNIVQEPEGLMSPEVYICPPMIYNQTKLVNVYEANEKADIKWLDMYDAMATIIGTGTKHSMFNTHTQYVLRREHILSDTTNKRLAIGKSDGVLYVRQIKHNNVISIYLLHIYN
jgi:hypothetical protein